MSLFFKVLAMVPTDPPPSSEPTSAESRPAAVTVTDHSSVPERSVSSHSSAQPQPASSDVAMVHDTAVTTDAVQLSTTANPQTSSSQSPSPSPSPSSSSRVPPPEPPSSQPSSYENDDFASNPVVKRDEENQRADRTARNSQAEDAAGNSRISVRMEVSKAPPPKKALLSLRFACVGFILLMSSFAIASMILPWTTLQWGSEDDRDPELDFYVWNWQAAGFTGLKCDARGETVDGYYAYDDRPCVDNIFNNAFPYCNAFIISRAQVAVTLQGILVSSLILCVTSAALFARWAFRPRDKKCPILGLFVSVSNSALLMSAVISSANAASPLANKCLRDFYTSYVGSAVDQAHAEFGNAVYVCVTGAVAGVFVVLLIFMEFRNLRMKDSLMEALLDFDEGSNELREMYTLSQRQYAQLEYDVEIMTSMQKNLVAKVQRGAVDDSVRKELEKVERALEDTRTKMSLNANMTEYLSRNHDRLYHELANRVESINVHHEELNEHIRERLTKADEEIAMNVRQIFQTRLDTLERRIGDLDTDTNQDCLQLGVLSTERESQRARLLARERIMDETNCPHLRRFYITFQTKLNSIFEAARVLSTGMVERKKTSKIDKVATVVSLAGALTPIPGLSAVFDAIASMIVVGNDVKHNRKHTKQATVFVSTMQLSQVVEEIAFELTTRFEKDLYEVLVTDAFWFDTVVFHAEQCIRVILEYVGKQPSIQNPAVEFVDVVMQKVKIGPRSNGLSTVKPVGG